MSDKQTEDFRGSSEMRWGEVRWDEVRGELRWVGVMGATVDQKLLRVIPCPRPSARTITSTARASPTGEFKDSSAHIGVDHRSRSIGMMTRLLKKIHNPENEVALWACAYIKVQRSDRLRLPPSTSFRQTPIYSTWSLDCLHKTAVQDSKQPKPSKLTIDSVTVPSHHSIIKLRRTSSCINHTKNGPNV